MNCDKVMSKSWDVLIILDAMRYDYFKVLYREYFAGKLYMLNSCGSASPEWFYNNFVQHNFDESLLYISANPYINSKTRVKSYIRGLRKKLIYYYASEHVDKIIDAWYVAYDDRYSVVPPHRMTRLAIKSIMKYEKRFNRIVVHYMQPHMPFISERCKCNTIGKCNTSIQNNPMNVVFLGHSILFNELLDLYPKLSCYRKLFSRFFNNEDLLFNRCALNLDYCISKFGCKELRRCYLWNLVYVLDSVSILVNDLINLGYKVVISSDHGEMLCEYGSIGHWNGSNRYILRQVPWFEVSEVKKKKRDISWILC